MAHVKKLGMAIVLVLVVALVVACAPEAGRPEDSGSGAGRVVAAQGTMRDEETDAKVQAGPDEVKEVDATTGDDLPAVPAEAASPEEAARSFYEWYIAYTDMAAGRTVRADEAYRNHPLLTEELVGRIEETYASMQGGGYDPFLCAQDVPTAVSVGPARVYEDQAWLTMYTTFPGHSLDLALTNSGDLWRISEITCHVPEEAASRTPEQVVQTFYNWYIHYPGNPLADKAFYGFGMYLTQDLIEETVEIVAGFEMGGYDPILLAQDLPTDITVQEAEVRGDDATVRVDTSWDGHALTLRLVRDGSLWKIDGIERAQ